MKLSSLTATEMRVFEEFAMEKHGVTIESMMERAGRAVFEVAMKECPHQNVLVVAGKGNNGGDAIVAAELLKKEGVQEVSVYQPYNESSDKIDWGRYNLIIDGLFGFSLKGNPRAPADEAIRKMNSSKVPILSIDVPSGLDAETGQMMTPAVCATYTVTLGMPKVGLDAHKDYVGKLFLGNVGIPETAYLEMGLPAPGFFGKNYIPLAL